MSTFRNVAMLLGVCVGRRASSTAATSAKVKDWPLLAKAVAQKLDDQTAFVAWWEGAVTVGHRPGRGGAKQLRANRGVIPVPVAKAEKLSGIRHQQVR